MQDKYNQFTLIGNVDYRKKFFKGYENIIKNLSYEEIKRKGWVICSIPIQGYRSFSGQKRIFVLRKKEYFVKGIIYDSLPKDITTIIFNIETKKIKLVGRGCSPKWEEFN